MVSCLFRTLSRTGICGYVLTEIFSLDNIEERKIYHFFDFGCNIGQYVCGTNMLLIFLERLYATKKALTYEHQFTPIIMLLLSLIIWTIVIGFLFAIFYFQVTLIAPVATCVVMVLNSAIGIGYVLYLNRKLYKKRADLNKNLSFRYQVSENVRSFEILIPMLIMLIIGCTITMIVYSTMPILTDVHSKALIGAIFNFIIVTGGVIVPTVMILSLQSYRDKFFGFLRRFCCCCQNANQNTQSKVVLLTLSQKEPDDVTNFYFKQISIMWN
uniref:Uncharacterized protein n=1 Tax=Panagrolaimus superbus TaxID=310955 RepID=A0A914Y4T9_9BILA